MPRQNSKPQRVEPTEDGQRLRIVWRDGHVSEYVPRQIRLACPCAGCVDEFTGRPILDPSSVPADIMPVSIEYVGRYALAFAWPDGHDTGIYPYDLLRGICPCDECEAERAETEADESPGRGPESSGAITFDSMRRQAGGPDPARPEETGPMSEQGSSTEPDRDDVESG